MKLEKVLEGIGAEPVGKGASKVEVRGLAQDSRKVNEGDLFIALPGAKVSGDQFIADAVKKGAVAVASEKPITGTGVPTFKVASARKAIALMAANFYGQPAKDLRLLGVTGTNGKTTTTYLLDSICTSGGAMVGRIGTIDHRYGGKIVPAMHTTPDPIELHRLFREMVDDGTDTVVMEVSSHALDQDRVYGLTFQAAAFTNLTRDHLDYHRDMEDYFQSKRKLFVDNLSVGGVAVVNGDDTYANRIYSELRGQKRIAWKFSPQQGNGEISVSDLEASLSGIKGTLKTPAGDIPLRSPLIGVHNLENILAACGVALAAGFSRRHVQDGIERMARVPGRMEKVELHGITVLVDYAHTDDALKRALDSLKRLTKGRVLAVFGCGGDRDKGKRPLMGEAAAEFADLAVVTSDNPRTEDPEDIIAEITPGLEKHGVRRISAGKARSGEKGYLVEVDRKTAIEVAVGMAKAGDVILVAGKGHEQFQVIDDEKHPFDDLQQAERALQLKER